MPATVAEIPRVPVPLEDAPQSDTYLYRTPGSQHPAAAIDRLTGRTVLRRTFRSGTGITFDHGNAPVWRPAVREQAHHIHWQPQEGLRFKYESYADHVKLTIYADERYGQNTVTYQGTVDAGLVYRRREKSHGAVWELVDGDRVIAFHPPPKVTAGGQQIPAGLTIVQDGQTVTYTVTLDAEAATAAYTAGHVIEIDPTTVATSTQSMATFSNNKRMIDRSQNGVLWLMFRSDDKTLKFYYSQDDGQTWAQDTGTITTVASGVIGSFFIDVDDYAHVVYNEGGTIKYRRGTPNASRTAWTWSAEQSVMSTGSTDNATCIAHQEGTGWKVHVVANRSYVDPSNEVAYVVVTVASDGTISVGSQTTISNNYAGSDGTNPSIDFNHNGDGKTVAGSPHLYVAWSGVSSGIKFKKATYSGGSWSWGTEQTLSATHASASRVSASFDGTRVVVAYVPNNASTTVSVVERDAADTTTTTRTPPALSDGAVLGVSVAYDKDANVYLLVITDTSDDPKWVKYTRSSDSWGSWSAIEATTAIADSISVKRGYFDGSGGSIECAYTTGTASPYNVRYDRTVVLNAVPTEPTLTASPTAFDAADGCDITIEHNDPDSGDTMSAYALKRDVGGTIRWWDAAAEDFSSTTEVWNAASGTSVSIAKAKNAGNWTNETTPNLYAATKDAAGTAGPYNATAVQVKVSAKPVVTITSPAEGGTATTDRITVEWTYTDSQDQKEYRVRLLSSADAELWSSGWVASKTARSRTVDYTLTNNTSYKAEVTVRDSNGVESLADTNSFSTSFTTPLAAKNVETVADADNAAVKVRWQRGKRVQGTFSRASVAYDPDTGTQIASGSPRYVPGRFQNLFTKDQSDVENGISGWVTQGAGSTISASTEQAWQGSQSIKVVTEGTSAYEGVRSSPNLKAKPGGKYTFSAWIYPTESITIRCRMTEFNADGSYLREPSADFNLTAGSWQRISVTVTVGSDTYQIRGDIQWPYGAGQQFATTYYLDGFQMEEGALTDWREGGTGKCIFIEEGTTNLLTANQSDVETDTSGFTAASGATISRDTTEKWRGSASLKVVTPGSVSAEGVRTDAITVSANTVYSGSVYVKAPAGTKMQAQLSDLVDHAKMVKFTASGVWDRVKIENHTTDSHTSLYLIIQTDSAVAAQVVTFYVDGLQLEQRSYVTSWQIGGTARANENLTIPTANNVSAAQGCWRQWVYVTDVAKRQDGTNYPMVFHIPRSDLSTGFYFGHFPNSANWRLYTRNDAGTSKEASIADSYTPNGWHLIEVKWKTSEMKCFIDGVLRATITDPTLPTFGDSAYVGHYSTSHYLNTYHDDIHILNTYPTDQESADYYARTAPAEWTEYSLIVAPFDDDLEMGTQNEHHDGTWRIERRKQGDTAWTALKTVTEAADSATGSQKEEYVDYSPGSGVTYEYRLVAIGSNTTEQAGSEVSGSVTFENPRFIPVDETSSGIRFYYNWRFNWRPEEDVHVPPTRSKYRPVYSGPTYPMLVDIEGDFLEQDSLTARQWKERVLDIVERRLEGWLKSPNGDVYRGHLLNPGGSLRMSPATRERMRLQFRETKKAV